MGRPWEHFTNQKQWKEYLQWLVRTNKRALYRSIVLIADLQTPEEKALGTTIDHNKQGFGIVDASLMTSLALVIKSGGELSERELAISRNKMPKYWRQLMIIAKGKMKDDSIRKEKDKQAVETEEGSSKSGEDHPETLPSNGDIHYCHPPCGIPSDSRITTDSREG